jgi:hypothetical protein
VTIYDEVESALADDEIGGDRQKAHWLTFRDYEEWMAEPEALEVVVTGIDRRLYRPLQAIKRDEPRIDAFAAVEDRPDGWLGESRPFGWVDGTLTTQDAVNRACDLLYARMHVPRWFCEWKGELLRDPATGVPLWPGDVVKLRFLSGDEPDDHDVRIVSLSADLELEPYEGGSDMQCRSASYMAEHLTDEADGLGYKTFARSLIEMREWAGLAIHSRTVGPSVGEPWAFGLPAGGGPIIRP